MPPRGSGWVKKPDYASIRKQLIKCNCIDDNTGFMILNLRSKDIFISKSDNTIVIIFQDFTIFKVEVEITSVFLNRFYTTFFFFFRTNMFIK